MTRILFWRREPREAVSPGRPRYTFGHGSEDVLCECRPDYQCEHNGPVSLSTVRGLDAARPAPDVPHQGATEDWSPIAELDNADRQPTAAISLLDTAAMRLEADRILHEQLSEVEARLREAYDAWWPTFLKRIGVTEAELAGVRDFDQVLEAAGVIALPAQPVDYATQEMPVVVA